jgi:hypothetical protein
LAFVLPHYILIFPWTERWFTSLIRHALRIHSYVFHKPRSMIHFLSSLINNKRAFQKGQQGRSLPGYRRSYLSSSSSPSLPSIKVKKQVSGQMLVRHKIALVLKENILRQCVLSLKNSWLFKSLGDYYT